MNVQDILTAIASVGFPIVACAAMAYFFAKVNANYRNDIKEMTAKHQEEVKQMTEAIQNNTLALQHLTDKIGG